MKNNLLFPALLFFFSTAGNAQDKIDYALCGEDWRPIYMHAGLPKNGVYADTQASPERRVADVLKRLSFEEKLTLTGGWNKMHYPGIARLGIPPVYFADATQGIHLKDICVKMKKSTSFPGSIALAATWNTGLAYQYAQALSEECRAWGVSVLLGPGVNMYRNAEGGRNYEYFGEDPLLASRMAVEYVKGMQSIGTIATVKHFIGNEQEFARHVSDDRISERALREIYLPPFKAALQQGGALALMTGNNMVNGFPGAANTPLTQEVLRAEYGFKGMIMSDWANSIFWSDSLKLVANSGQSLLMENNDLFVNYIREQIKVHAAKKEELENGLDRMVTANLYTLFKSGVYDRPYRDPSLVSKIDGHAAIARKTAEEGITLLKNKDNILPLKPSLNKILVLGEDQALTAYVGKGSGNVLGFNHTDYLQGLKKEFGNKVIRSTVADSSEIKAADVVLYFINKPAGEGFDVEYNKPDFTKSINEVATLNKNVIVIYSGGNGLPTPWIDKIKGFVFAYLLGQERGNALAGILSGKVNPSGKLPFTIEKDFSESPAHDYNKMPDGNYYRQGGKGESQKMFDKFGTIPVNYREGIYIGYRWFEKKKIQPQFPFGFGLSYTSFTYKDISVSSKKISSKASLNVSLTIENIGAVDGAEVVEIYIHENDSKTDRPEKELKGFTKVFLKAGESKTVAVSLKFDDFAFWNEQVHHWQVNKGTYTIMAASSSAEIKASTNVVY